MCFPSGVNPSFILGLVQTTNHEHESGSPVSRQSQVAGPQTRLTASSKETFQRFVHFQNYPLAFTPHQGQPGEALNTSHELGNKDISSY